MDIMNASPPESPPRNGKGRTQRPITPGQMKNQNEIHLENDQSQHNGEDESNLEDPEDQMEPFDWQDLESRYIQAMEEKNEEEEALLQEFEDLCTSFGIWAETISGHEQERGLRRLKTQSVLVQKQEEDLEQRRAHYLQVVNAFKQALKLLNR